MSDQEPQHQQCQGQGNIGQQGGGGDEDHYQTEMIHLIQNAAYHAGGKQGLADLLSHQTGKEEWEFDPKWVNAVCILKVELSDYCVKQHKAGMRK